MTINWLYFIKLLPYEIDPKYFSYNIFKESGFGYRSSEAFYPETSEINLLEELLEVINGLKRHKKYMKRIIFMPIK